jgi:hypothetical protein
VKFLAFQFAAEAEKHKVLISFTSLELAVMCKHSHKKRIGKLVCVQNESVIKLLCCAHVSCLALLFILASFVFEMVSKRWIDGGFMCSQKAMLLSFLACKLLRRVMQKTFLCV